MANEDPHSRLLINVARAIVMLQEAREAGVDVVYMAEDLRGLVNAIDAGLTADGWTAMEAAFLRACRADIVNHLPSREVH